MARFFSCICRKFAEQSQYLIVEFAFIEEHHPEKAVFPKICFCLHACYWMIKRLLRKGHLSLCKLTPLRYGINLDSIELELTNVCNLKCLNCNRSCGEAPSNDYLRVEEIERFISESIRGKKKWAFIRLLGGEPSLHPDILRVCDLLIAYKRYYSPNTKITLVTNGFGSHVQQILQQLPGIIHIENSQKPNTKRFEAYNLAPVDVSPQKDYSKGCPITSICGLSLTPNGYYACGPGGSADRVFDWQIGIPTLSEITKKKLRAQLNVCCKYCGHMHGLLAEGHPISTSWQKAYQDYRGRQTPAASPHDAQIRPQTSQDSLG